MNGEIIPSYTPYTGIADRPSYDNLDIPRYQKYWHIYLFLSNKTIETGKKPRIQEISSSFLPVFIAVVKILGDRFEHFTTFSYMITISPYDNHVLLIFRYRSFIAETRYYYLNWLIDAMQPLSYQIERELEKEIKYKHKKKNFFTQLRWRSHKTAQICSRMRPKDSLNALTQTAKVVR